MFLIFLKLSFILLDPVDPSKAIEYLLESMTLLKTIIIIIIIIAIILIIC